MQRLQLWAGAECSVTRVGDEYRDQLTETGHGARLDDLDRVASLGVTTVRLPVLWERVAPEGLGRADWSWSDAWLGRARSLGLRVIVGLVHHGSGPRTTSLVAPTFASGLGEFAGAVAERYPWVEDWTPVNEPLTTARFSGLYGHWYPHGRLMEVCVRALLNEVQATAAAMRAVRAVRADARLVQTEDIGTVFSTPALERQAAYENERRWLSLDLLCGWVDERHRLYRHLLAHGAGADELAALQAAPCPPEIIGINYYVTSDRFLDERVERYPRETHGGNGRQAYADVEAVRVRGGGIVGHQARLREVWARYGRPLAVTETHLGCSREEQLRWLHEAWSGAESARRDGVDVRAVTAWAAFGTVDWDSLLTRRQGHYEPGLFDARVGDAPRPTALAKAAAELARGGAATHPVLDANGWWRSPRRLTYPVHGSPAPRAPQGRARPVLIVGADGRLGRALQEACARRGLVYRALSRAELDVSDAAAVREYATTLAPWAVVSAASAVRPGETSAPWRVERAHVTGPAVLADACARAGIRLALFSSDYVFDGSKGTPYVERDEIAPTCALGRAYAEGERRALGVHPAGTLVLRSGPLFGGNDALARALDAIAAGRTRPPGASSATPVMLSSPTFIADLVETTLDLLIDDAMGIVHVANHGSSSFEGLVGRAATRMRLWAASSEHEHPPLAGDRSLASSRVAALPPLDDALDRYLASRTSTALGKTGS